VQKGWNLQGAGFDITSIRKVTDGAASRRLTKAVESGGDGDGSKGDDHSCITGFIAVHSR
jgi:hypothetical protein